jgi:hypothetical protein
MSTENKFPGLQIADAIASSIAQGLEYDRNFHTLEHRYMKILKPKIYKAKGDENYRDSGMKLHPYPLREHMEYDQRVLWMRKYYW